MSGQGSPSVEALLGHTGFVRNLARGALGRDDESEDVAQDAWVAALERGPRDPRAARGWFYRVVQNRVRTLGRRETLRRRHLCHALEGAAGARAVPSPAEILAREESRRRLVEALLRLDPAHREPLVLRYYEDLPPREIARRLGLPVETVRTRLRRGIERLRRALDARFGDRRAWALGLVPLARLPRSPGSRGVALAGSARAAAVVLALGGAGLLAHATLSADAPGSPPEPPRAAEARVRELGLLRAPDASAGAVARAAEPLVAAAAPAPVFTITVLDSDGDPLSGALVRVAETRADFGFEHDAVVGRTDAQGRFRIPRAAHPAPADGVPAATFALEVAPPREREDLAGHREDDWRPSDATVPLGPGLVVAGEVVDRAGRPVPGATVRLGEGGRSARTTADASGGFRLAGLAPGRWRARATLRGVHGEITSEEALLDGGARDLRLQVDAGETLLVRLPPDDVRALGSRAPPLRVTAHEDRDVSLERATEHPVPRDGVVRLQGLRAGVRYALWWGPDALGRHAYEPSAVAADGRVELGLREGGFLRVEVERPPGWDAWPRVRVRARGFEAVGTCALDGSCAFAGLPDVDLHVTASARDASGREATGEVRVRPQGRPEGATAALRLSPP